METEVSPLLVEFRKLLTEQNLDAYIIPRTDPHKVSILLFFLNLNQSELLPPCDERLKFISSFSGSNGVAVITPKEALMWTDSRYFLQVLCLNNM